LAPRFPKGCLKRTFPREFGSVQPGPSRRAFFYRSQSPTAPKITSPWNHPARAETACRGKLIARHQPCAYIHRLLSTSTLSNMSPVEEFALELSRVSRRWRARLDERLKHTGLTQARWVTLLYLANTGPVSQRELAGMIGIEGPTLVRLLDHLEQQGLIERRGSDADRRVNVIHLTDRAKPLLDEITRIAAELRRELLADIPAGDLAVAGRVLKAIADKLEGSSS